MINQVVLLLIGRRLDYSSELQRSRQPANGDLTSLECMTSSGRVPFSNDSIERYFRSLQEVATADESVVPAPPTSTSNIAERSTSATAAAKDDVDELVDGRSYGAAAKRSFRARVDAVKRSLLQTTDNDGPLFTRVTSKVKGRDPCSYDDFSKGRDRDNQVSEVNVRDSENFVYEESEERKRATLTCLPDALRKQLLVDLGNSMESVALTQKLADETEIGESSQRVTRPRDSGNVVTSSGCHITDSVTFDYVDLPVENSLPEDLRQELRLDLRDSAEYLREDDQTALVEHDDADAPSSKVEAKSAQRTASLAVLEEPQDDDDVDRISDGDVENNAIKGEDLLRHTTWNNSCNNLPLGNKSQILSTSSHQVTHDPSRLQSSGKPRRLRVFEAADGDVLKPVPSKTRPQTAAAAVATAASSQNVSKKKTVAWGRESTQPNLQKSSVVPSADKVRRPTTAHALGGRQTSSASANQHSASWSADQRKSRER